MGRSQLSAIIQLMTVQPEIMAGNDMAALLLGHGVGNNLNIAIVGFKPTGIVQAVTTVLLLIGSDQQMRTGIDGTLIVYLSGQQADMLDSGYRSRIQEMIADAQCGVQRG
ncbi:hypothetical protein VSP9026_03803 [Vibrio spartinae]|uniref:Uncharacterized protein n=1 Tax=Vibrio spartinae TaxID=1918945 RepID=A0A1N6M9L7_9VIBR|nr:hypothetical protein VSP9026_03803 [Vibrio spartinae]